MSLLAILRVAARALARNRGRSFLTVLGIIIGVAAVIAMVAVGEGARVKVQAAFDALGTNLLLVRSGASHTGGAHGGYGSQPTITLDDVAAITQLPNVQKVAVRPEVKVQLVSEQSNWATDVGGATPEFFQIRVWPVSAGRQLTQADVDGGSKVMLLGQTVSTQLFGEGVNPVGQTVRVLNVPFTVIGLLERKGQTPWGGDLDDNCYVPVTAYRSRLSGGLRKFADGTLFIRVRAPEDAARTESQITELLRDRHHLSADAEDDFHIRNMVELASARDEGARTMRTLLASVAAVSLLIAGIGVMNIMLVSVTERTREIGLRMAVGARGRDILVQFLVEALVLSVSGGAIGIALGIGASRWLSASFDWPLLLPADGVVAAVVTSAGVGIVFGLYPAWRASALDPIEALRYES
jgi:putative ABC transport system permease protein